MVYNNMMKARAAAKVEDQLATKSLQTRYKLQDDDARKSLKSFEFNNSVFVMNETQQALKHSINNPILVESLDGDLERIKS